MRQRHHGGNEAVADPLDVEGRDRTGVTGEFLDEGLGVFFAVRPGDEVPAVRADPPALRGELPGQRDHLTV